MIVSVLKHRSVASVGLRIIYHTLACETGASYWQTTPASFLSDLISAQKRSWPVCCWSLWDFSTSTATHTAHTPDPLSSQLTTKPSLTATQTPIPSAIDIPNYYRESHPCCWIPLHLPSLTVRIAGGSTLILVSHARAWP